MMKKLSCLMLLLAILILTPSGVNAKSVKYTKSVEEKIVNKLSEYNKVHFIHTIKEDGEGQYSEFVTVYDVNYDITAQTADIALKIKMISPEEGNAEISGKLKIDTSTGELLKKDPTINDYDILDLENVLEDMAIVGNSSMKDFYLKLTKQYKFELNQSGKTNGKSKVFVKKTKTGNRKDGVKTSKITASLTIRKNMPIKISRKMLTHPTDYLSFKYNTDLVFKTFSK